MTPTDLPSDLLGLTLVVLMLGIKHGFDADHLAAIDGLTRYNTPARPRLARLVGVLFSAGHGIVVVGVALGVSLLTTAWQPPAWLDAFGAWLSIGILTLLALLNIAAVLRTPAHQRAHLAGWRSGVFGRLLHAHHPAAVVGVGSLFALSFDTVGLAALFALTATQFGGWQPALLLALLFIAGMLATDGLNGWWIARLIRRSDAASRTASRVMALAVSGVSLLTAGLGVVTQTVPDIDAWADGRSLWFGGAIVLVIFASFVLGQRLAGGAAARDLTSAP
ncbi:MAG: nickel transporter [Methylibium sp. NZG]|nr:MAG: nickel transporter [Methylibium sp. NZG]